MTAIINGNVRMLLSVAQKYRERAHARGVFLEDLFAVASIGLQTAVMKFDFSMNCRLNTYAAWWMRQELDRGVQDLGSTIRIPAHVSERTRKLRQIISRYRTEFGRDPDHDTLRELSGFTIAQVKSAMAAPGEPSSLDRQNFELDGSTNGRATLVDLIPDPEHEEKSPAAQLDRARQSQRLNKAMETFLRPMERDVLRCRFTMDLTLEGTAKALAKPGCEPLCRERIRQIETSALKKLRAGLPGLQ